MEVAQEQRLRDKWVLWFHRVDDDNWKEDSYIKVYEMDTVEDLIFVLREIPNITSGMFFFMKDGIFPTYEDPLNRNGGYWSLRVSKKDSMDVWQSLIYHICVDKLTKDPNMNELINGFTVSPKINNCIFKIWNRDYKRMKTDNMRRDIKVINFEESFYLKHQPDS